MAKDKSKLWEKWELLNPDSNKLGQGGQGVVRKVKNLQSGELGALKELTNCNSPERRKRMKIEAVSLSVLEHNNICKILDSNTTSTGKPYIITNFIDGVTLEDKIAQSHFSLHEMHEFAKELLSALHYAHSIPVYHRDIKPGNIMLRDGRSSDPVLIDFGLSFNEEENIFSSATYDGQQLGNRFLHLPELQRGARDPRSDITQLCGVFLYTITGIPPISLVNAQGEYPH